MIISFRSFIEKKEDPENYLDGMWRELGIDPNNIPDFIETGPIEISDENIIYNQAIWQVVKPIDISDKFVRIKLHQFKSPNLNQHTYRRREDGKLVPYEGKALGNVHLIPIDKFAEVMSRGWQAVTMGAGMGAF